MMLSACLASFLLLLPRVSRTQGECHVFCTCDGDRADCTAREALEFRFTEIPTLLPPTTTELFLTNNHITNLSSTAFSHLPLLEKLHLDHNLISSLSADYFDSLPQLETLILDGNPLHEITGDGVFASLTSLLELSIQDTPLTEFNGVVFRELSTLTELVLDDNQLFSLSTNFLEHLPALTLLSLTGNVLETLSDGFLTGAPVTTVQLELQDNPWSCDCRLQWMADLVAANPTLIPTEDMQCLWPPSLVNTPFISVSPTDSFTCNAPSISQQPQNDSILTNAPYSLEVTIDGAPFPEVVWNRDGKTVNYTEKVFVSGYDASLMFTTVVNDDVGVYSVSLSNEYGSLESVNITLSVTEATCVDEELSEIHETDIDCGGQYCQPCPYGKRCLVDSDCSEDLVCLYTHQLPSQLFYMSPNDPLAYTCANASVPQSLLQSLISTTSDDLPLTVAGNSSKQEIEELFHSFITEALSVPRESLSGVTVNSVERNISPLLQFEAQVVRNCEETVANLNSHIDSGSLKATLKTTEGQGRVCYGIRLNI